MNVSRRYKVLMSTIGERIRERRKIMGITQAALAEAFGINRVSVTQWELGTTSPEVDKIVKLAQLLDCDPEWLLSGNGSAPVKVNGKASPNNLKFDPPNAIIGSKVEGLGRKIPVYGQAVGGVDGEFLMNGTVLYEVMAPPVISHISGAYAVSVAGESMSPRYMDGEICFIDPSRRVKKGDFVVAQVKMDEHAAPYAYVKRFVRHNSIELVLEQFNPPKELRFPASHVESVHYIALAGNA